MKPPSRFGGPPRADAGPRPRGNFNDRGGPGGPRRNAGDAPARRSSAGYPPRDGAPDPSAYLDRPPRAPREGGFDRPRNDEGRPAAGYRPRPEGGGGFKPRGEGGGFKPRGEGGGGFRPRTEGGGGGFRPRPEGGYPPRGEGGGFKPRGEGGGGFRPRPEGAYPPRGEGGGFKPRTEGGGGGFRPRPEGGYPPRGEGGGFRPRTEGGGFKPRGEGGGFRPRPEGGFKPRGEGAGFRPRPEGGGPAFKPRQGYGEERGTLRAPPRRDDALRPRGPAGDDRGGRGSYGGGERRFEPAFRAHQPDAEADALTTHARARRAEADAAAAANAAREVDLAEQRRNEFRVHGLNAVLALHRQRPQAIRKLWFSAARRETLADLITWCAREQVGFNEVDAVELERITGTEHHEGVCVAAVRPDLPALDLLLGQLARAKGPQLVLLLDRIGNPHNLGAILRSAAHFGAAAVLLTPDSPAVHSGAAYRVAEGGAEAQPVATLATLEQLDALTAAGYVLAATRADAPTSMLAPGALPPRVILALGNEGSGLGAELVERSSVQLAIPGSGAVESLNVAAAAAVALAAWRIGQPQGQ